MNKVEIKRVEADGHTFWSVYCNDGRVTDLWTFRKAWNAAKKLTPDAKAIILDPIDLTVNRRSR